MVQLNWGGLAYSLRRYYVDEFYFRHVPSLPGGSWVLDLGGHKTIKRGQFDIERYGFRVVYANLSTQKGADVQADAARLPLRADSFDGVICAELLEHVPDPLPVLSEARRVLKRGGHLFVSAPFLYQLHGDPHDFGRYTDSYWRQNLARSGFEIAAIEKQGLFWSVLVDMLRAYLAERLSGNGLAARVMRRTVALALIALGKRLGVKWDVRAGRSAFLRSYTTGFGIVARKRC